MLKQGDLVELIAPASGITRDEYDSCLKFIEDLGLKARVPNFDSLIDSEYGFLANSVEKRESFLIDAIMAEDSKAIWCMSGGYGSYQLLEALDSVKPFVKKTLVGFSDTCVLLNYASDKWDWECIHGAMLKNLANDELTHASMTKLRELLFESSEKKINELIACNSFAKEDVEIEGELVGGCLSLMQTFIGTPQDIDYEGKILLLEDDRFETPERISRVLNHMLRAGIFDKVSAVILGSFLESDDQKGELKLAFLELKNALDKQKKPLLWGEKLGHCPDMQPLLLGAEAKIRLGEKPALKFMYYPASFRVTN